MPCGIAPKAASGPDSGTVSPILMSAPAGSAVLASAGQLASGTLNAPAVAPPPAAVVVVAPPAAVVVAPAVVVAAAAVVVAAAAVVAAPPPELLLLLSLPHAAARRAKAMAPVIALADVAFFMPFLP